MKIGPQIQRRPHSHGVSCGRTQTHEVGAAHPIRRDFCALSLSPSSPLRFPSSSLSLFTAPPHVRFYTPPPSFRHALPPLHRPRPRRFPLRYLSPFPLTFPFPPKIPLTTLPSPSHEHLRAPLRHPRPARRPAPRRRREGHAPHPLEPGRQPRGHLQAGHDDDEHRAARDDFDGVADDDDAYQVSPSFPFHSRTGWDGVGGD